MKFVNALRMIALFGCVATAGATANASDREHEECLENAKERFNRAIEGCDALENPSDLAREACYQRVEKDLERRERACEATFGKPRLR